MTGELFFNNTDAYTQWGVSLEDGGLEALMAFRPNKEPVTNKNVTADGAAIVCGTGRVDERTVSVPMHLVASSTADFLTKLASFQAFLNGSGVITLRTEYGAYSLCYLSCSNYTQTLNGLAKFSLTFYEPNS